MKWKSVIIEVVILAIIFAISITLSTLITGGIFGLSAFDINLHDTYFVIKFSRGFFLLFPMSLLTLLAYAIRSAINHFSIRLQNIILTSSIFFAIVFLLKAYMYAAFFERATSTYNNGWTIYPPLSALAKMPQAIHRAPTYPITNGMLIILIIFLILLVISAVLTGKNWHTKKHELPKA